MAETHINAYYQEVDEKRAAANRAQSELQAAKERLTAKEVELGITPTVIETPQSTSEKVDDTRKKK